MLLTLLAKSSYEALRENTQQGIGEIKGINAHIQQAYNSFRGTVGVQSAEHQMTRQGCLQACFGSS